MEIAEQELPDTASPIVIDHDSERISEQPAPASDVSELEQHKRDRGFTPPAKAEPERTDLAPLPDTAVEAKTETPEPKKPERWKDPETGDTYDMRHKVARRIKQVLEKAAKAEERATKAEQARDEAFKAAMERAGHDQRPTQPQADPNAEPDPSDATKYPEGQYDRAFIRDQASFTARQETSRAMQTEHARTQEAQVVTRWQETLPEAIKKYPDFEDALGKIPNTPENAPITRVMLGSPVGNDVVYAFATDARLMGAYRSAPNPDARMRLLYHVEAQILAASRSTPKKEPATTNAPMPTAPVHAGAGPNGPVDWSRTDDPDQYQRFKQMRQRR